MTNADSFDFILIGRTETLKSLPPDYYEGLKEKTFSDAAALEKFFEDGQFPDPLFVVVVSDLAPMSLVEIAQAFGSYVPGVQVICVLNESSDLDLKSLKKNGYADVFLVPMDRKYVESTFLALKSKKGLGGKHYKPVKLIDLNPGDELPYRLSLSPGGSRRNIAVLPHASINIKRAASRQNSAS